MPFNARCWMRQPAVLLIAVICLSGCVRAGFEYSLSMCPTLVEYSMAEQAQVADEVAKLPDGVLLMEWLADYAVLREQVRACSA